MKQLLLIALPVAVLLAADVACADTTVTITQNNTACQVSTPADVTPPATPNVSAGVQAAKNRNFAMARANFQPLAESGNVEAQRDMGTLLMQDCTGIQDKEAAATWLTKAADGGDVLAQAQLGNAYMTGNGVAQDDTKAIPLLTKAATAGNGNAQANLGYIYSTGRGVPKDKYQFMVWTVKGGEQGTPVALMNIAEAYLRGEAVPQDNDKAAYYMTAAAQRATGAQRSRFLTAVNNLSRQMSLADFKHEAERAQRWSPGPGSLSDVLDDAARRQKQGSQG
jgi:TPR repeat protein